MALSLPMTQGELLTAPAEEEPFSPGSERDYLNHLVAKTAAATDVQVRERCTCHCIAVRKLDTNAQGLQLSTAVTGGVRLACPR